MKMRAGVFLAAAVFFYACSGSTSLKAGRSQADNHQESTRPELLSAEGQRELHQIVDSSKLADLQWPNFSDQALAVKEFYEEDGYRLGWSYKGKPTPQALQSIDLLENADGKGLDSKDYDGLRWPERLKVWEGADAAETDLVKFDVALTVSAIRYGTDLHLGKVDPRTLHKDFDPEREKHNAGTFLWKYVVNAKNVSEVLTPIEPPYPGYKRTLVALQKYLQLAKQEVADPLPQVAKPVMPGGQYPALDKLVHRLQFLGDLPASASVPTAYSGEVVDGVKNFQSRHGLEAAGKLGPQTIAELNVSLNDRVESLRLTLERWRWVPHEFAQAPIIVNIPEFVLRTFNKPGEPTLTMPVVVGRAMRNQTPVMEESMKYLIFWPYWNVPPSILRGEIIPKIAKDPGYVQKNNFEVATYSGQVVTDGVVSEEVLSQLRAGKLMVRQKPGPKNALGLIKFIFPNDQNIYLHSTPAQALFGETRRDFSHGCIRVGDPKALAEWVLRNNPGWTRDRVEAAFKAQQEQQVNLVNEIPVLIVYGTAIVKDDGRAYFFDDLYGYDKALGKLYVQAYSSKS